MLSSSKESTKSLGRRPRLLNEEMYQKIKEFFFANGNNLNINEQFQEDPSRFDKFRHYLMLLRCNAFYFFGTRAEERSDGECSLRLDTPKDGTILVDFSKNRITEIVLEKLLELAEARNVEQARDAMMKGGRVNEIEKKPVLHNALRQADFRKCGDKAIILVDKYNIVHECEEFLEKMFKFVNAVHGSYWNGCSGKPFTDAVVIGHSSYTIPSQMVTEALTPYNKGMRIHYVSNVDGSAITEVLKNADRCRMLFIIVSKNFDDVDVMQNATTAKNWFLRGARKKWMKNHFVAITSHKPNAKKFGVHGCNIFRYGEYVGECYTVWSTIGVPVALSIGTKDFTRFLDGARFMDMHFTYAPLRKNAPVILAMIGIWYINFYGYETHAVLPYDQYMQRFPQYVQFLDMKSNGKSFLGRSRNEANFQTGPVTWGSAGSNSQHSFFQLLHQGTRIVPCDFIIPANSHNPIENNKHHKILVANFLAQSEALMKGRTEEQVREEMKYEPPEVLNSLCQHKVFSGNRPSNSIVVNQITPFTLGALIALYEHKAFVQSVVWDVDPFIHPTDDLIQQFSERILSSLLDPRKATKFDQSTNGLMAFIKRKMEPKSWMDYAMLTYESFTDPPVKEMAKKGEFLNLAVLAAMLFSWFHYFSNK